jgi:flagellar biosynthetic protein FliP
MIALALFMTFFVMSPVFNQIYEEAYKPLAENQITMIEAYEKGKVPLKAFMLKQTRKTDLEMFLQMANHPEVQDPDDLPMSILIPSFATSELKTAFQIGFAIFLPFLIIDMVVASVLMSMGMMMVSPAIVSLPFKLMLFVLVDGWHLIIGSLAQSFYL